MDLKASRVDDLVTIVVSETFSAVATGDVKTARQSSAKAHHGRWPELHAPPGRWPISIKCNTQTQHCRDKARPAAAPS